MISIRRSLSLTALAAALAFGAASAQADIYKGKQPHHGGGVPVVTSNSVTANNIAAGIGNKATQGVYADQSGASKKWYGGGGFTSNSTNANNIAAGIGNKANQEVMTRQSGGGGLTLNRVDAMNLAAGEHNFANQSVFAQQR